MVQRQSKTGTITYRYPQYGTLWCAVMEVLRREFCRVIWSLKAIENGHHYAPLSSIRDVMVCRNGNPESKILQRNGGFQGIWRRPSLRCVLSKMGRFDMALWLSREVKVCRQIEEFKVNETATTTDRGQQNETLCLAVVENQRVKNLQRI